MVCNKHVSIPADDRLWPWFLVTSLVIYGAGLVLIIIGRLFLCFYNVAQKRSNSVLDNDDDDDDVYNEKLEQGWYLDLKEGAGNLVSAQTLQGRILVRDLLQT